jgi:putative membrane protein
VSPALLAALPAVNALLNGTSAVFLLAGYLFIRRRRVTAHKICMLSAFVTSTIFLISYLTLRYFAGFTAFTGQGWIRPVYFTILISHTILAACILPLALTTLFRAWREQFPKHRRIARWTLPLWFYVSVTGVIVYLMLYRLAPSP